MKYLHNISLLLSLFLAVALISSNTGFSEESVPLINEVMSLNSTTIQDEDGDYSDWIEIYNPRDLSIDLTGYGLSDRPDNPFKWVFPQVIIDPDIHMLVFASGKDRKEISNHWETVINQGDEWSYRKGSSEIPENWNSIEFDDSEWQSGISGIGSRIDDATVVQQFISFYIRKTFDVADVSNITHCILHIDYEDSFVAYINGHEVARSNIGEIGIPLSFDQLALKAREMQIYAGGSPEEYEIENFQDIINIGENVLAIQVHNNIPAFSDLSVIPFLTLGMIYSPQNPRGLPDILNFFITDSYLHTNFKINAEGETLVLTDSAGTVCDSLFTGLIYTDISIGRQTDGASEWVYFSEPTPGESNITEGFQEYADSVTALLPGGFYDGLVEIELNTNSPNAKIRYTLDGSDPTDSSTIYTSYVPIDTTTVLRARAFEAGFLPGRITTHTYFINEDINLPVVSLSTTPANLWDDDIGICVVGNGTARGPYGGSPANWWEDWERPVHVEFYESDGSLGFGINAAVRMVGSSRNMVQKSFAIFARDRYGCSEINYQIFPDMPINKFKSFKLRNLSDDNIQSIGAVHFREGLTEKIIQDLDLEVQAYRPAVVFLNGVYWGIYSIREKQNEAYLASHHGVDPDNVDILDDYRADFIRKTNPVVGTSQVIEGDNNHYNAFIDFLLEHDLSDSINAEYVKTQMNVNNFLDYMAVQIYIVNHDGPGANCKFWRPKTPQGKYRWILFDTDHGFCQALFVGPTRFNPEAYKDNTIEYHRNGYPMYTPESTFIFSKILENEGFRNVFINRFSDYLNTIFTEEVVIPKINAIKEMIEPEMPRQLERWANEGSGVKTMSQWYSNIEVVEQFVKYRVAYVRSHIISEFNLLGEAQVDLAVSPPNTGKIQINTIIPESYPWNGTYFQDVPIQITALPNPGYKFTGWTGISPSDPANTMVNLTDNISITAIFEEGSSAQNTIVINEINYNSSVDVDPEDWVELYNLHDSSVDISGWVFKDANDTNEFLFPDNTVIYPDGYLVLCNDKVAFHTVFPDVDNYIGDLGFNLSNAGELIRLYNSEGSIVDSLTYDDVDPWTVEPDGTGFTLALSDPNSDNSLPENWTYSSNYGTPGAVNDWMSDVDEIEVPIAFSLGQNYPNPFNSVTTIPFSLPQSGRVTIEVYSILGQRVEKILDDYMTPGHHQVVFKPDDLASGLYIYTIKSVNFHKAKHMLLLK